MPSARILNDGLWHCLCPIFDLQFLTRSHRAWRLKTNRRNGCTSSPSITPKRRLTTSVPARNRQERQTLDGDGHGRGQFFTQRSPLGGVNYAPKSPDLTAIQLYDKLRLGSFKGNHKEIEDIVGILVRDHHEPPNIRLYNALILSNIDPVNGSAAKASILFREMTKEGIIPESGTYHALLKVRRASVHCTPPALIGLSVRSSRSIQTTICEVIYSHSSANDGLTLPMTVGTTSLQAFSKRSSWSWPWISWNKCSGRATRLRVGSTTCSCIHYAKSKSSRRLPRYSRTASPEES